MLRAADMTDRYKDGTLLRRWSLVAGWPRCVLSPLVVAESDPEEVAFIEAQNASLRNLVGQVEAYEEQLQQVEAARALLPEEERAQLEDPEPESTQIASLAQSRRLEPVGEVRVLATAEGSVITGLIVTDDPDVDGVEVPPTARVGGLLPNGVRPVFVPVPASVPLWKAKAVMQGVPHGDGTLFDAVDALTTSLGGPVRWWWVNGQEIERSHPLVAQLASAVGVEPLLDDLFRSAGNLSLS